MTENKTETQENSDDLIFYTNGEETFRISLQHFGRGSICPETKLEIKKNYLLSPSINRTLPRILSKT